MKVYKSEAWLRSQLKKKTVAQIADDCGVAVSTISRQIDKFGIK